MTLRFANNVIAHFHVNWLAPDEDPQTLLGCSKKMVVYDDVEPTTKFASTTRASHQRLGGEALPGSCRLSYRRRSQPKIDTTEALQRVAKNLFPDQ